MNLPDGELLKRSIRGRGLTIDQAAGLLKVSRSKLQTDLKRAVLSDKFKYKVKEVLGIDINGSEWVDAKQQLPTSEDGIYQLIYGEDERGDKDIYIAYLGSDKNWYYRKTEFSNVTHWMPLPQIPPK